MQIFKRLLRITRIALLAILVVYAGAAVAGNWLARNGFAATKVTAR
jgi:hypothetical protein